MNAARNGVEGRAQRLWPALRRAVAAAAISAALLCAPPPLSDLRYSPRPQGCTQAIPGDKEAKTAVNNLSLIHI